MFTYHITMLFLSYFEEIHVHIMTDTNESEDLFNVAYL